jgi:hypothetical protein
VNFCRGQAVALHLLEKRAIRHGRLRVSLMTR